METSYCYQNDNDFKNIRGCAKRTKEQVVVIYESIIITTTKVIMVN